MKRRELLRYLGATGVALHPVAGVLAAMQPETPLLHNQLGYLPGAGKQATVRGLAIGRPFALHSGQSVVFRGTASAGRSDPASGDTVGIADFSSLRAPGAYQLAAGETVGDLFQIGEHVYADALRVTMRAFYGQRCGCAVDLGGGYSHSACHAAGAFHPTSGRSGPLVNHGGWHDAGDYGRYIVNSGITTGTLLWAWELYPRTLRSLSLGIPESGGKLPDYLAEVRWNLEWMLSLQDTDGGVWHKQTSEHFCAFILPQEDKLTSYVIGTGSVPYKSTCATADLAAVMAIAARCYGAYDDAFAHRCVAAARLAWSWAVAHPDVTYTNPPSIATGGYGDRHCEDEVAWASAELWRTTGELVYATAFLDRLPQGALSAPSWGDVESMACWTYALAAWPGAPGTHPDVVAGIVDKTQAAAALLTGRSRQNGYGNTLALSEYGWGSNSTAANQSMLLLLADHFRADPAARDAAANNLHYLLGRNCHGVSWVTQLGVRPFQHPHHRPSAADTLAAPWPGLLSGGPNARGGDPVADKLLKQPPMRMWVDDERAYSLNEVAINWNAPLVFLLAALNA